MPGVRSEVKSFNTDRLVLLALFLQEDRVQERISRRQNHKAQVTSKQQIAMFGFWIDQIMLPLVASVYCAGLTFSALKLKFGADLVTEFASAMMIMVVFVFFVFFVFVHQKRCC